RLERPRRALRSTPGALPGQLRSHLRRVLAHAPARGDWPRATGRARRGALPGRPADVHDAGGVMPCAPRLVWAGVRGGGDRIPPRARREWGWVRPLSALGSLRHHAARAKVRGEGNVRALRAWNRAPPLQGARLDRASGCLVLRPGRVGGRRAISFRAIPLSRGFGGAGFDPLPASWGRGRDDPVVVPRGERENAAADCRVG